MKRHNVENKSMHRQNTVSSHNADIDVIQELKLNRKRRSLSVHQTQNPYNIESSKKKKI